jgi:hypothetical protein
LKESVKLTGSPAAAAGFCALAAIAHAPVVFLGRTFVDRDYLTLVLPMRSYLSQALRAGRWPQWCDGVGFGAPFLSNPQNQVLYPPAWLAALLPVPFACDVIVLLHLVWAGLGMRAFAAKLGAGPAGAFLAGAAFLLGGYTSSMVVMGTPLETLAWLPWIALAADGVAQAETWRLRGRAGAWLAAAIAAAFLAGDPAGVVTGLLLAVGVVLTRAPDRARRLSGLGALAGAGVLAGAVAGLLLVPAMMELREGQRSSGVSLDEATLWSMHPFRLLELAVPRAFGDQTNRTHTLTRLFADEGDGQDLDTTWASSIYLGIPLLVLALHGVRRERGLRALGIFSLFLLLVAFGQHTPVYGLYRKVVLVERILRYPERHLAGAMVLWTALAGLGFTRLFGDGPSRRMVLGLLAGAAALGALVIVEHLFAAGLVSHFEAANRLADKDLKASAALELARSGALSSFLVTACFAGVVAARRWLPFVEPWTPAGAAVVVLIGLAVEARAVLPLVDRAEISGMPTILQPLQGQERDYPGDKGLRPRIYRDRWLPIEAGVSAEDYALVTHELATENHGIPFGYAHVPGYQPGRTASARIDRFFRKVPIIVDAFDVRYLIMAQDKLPPGPKKTLNVAGPMALVESKRMRPRGYVAPRWTWKPTDDAALEGLFPDGIRDTGATRLIGSGPDAGPERKTVPPSRCGVEVSDPENVLLRCNSPRGGYAVLLDEWARGWTATVDGAAAPVERADALFRAVPIHPGAHQVWLRYSTPGLGLGIAATVLGLLACAGLWLAPLMPGGGVAQPVEPSQPRRRRRR